MVDIIKKKWYIVFCWAGFLITSGAGLGMFAAPEMNAKLILIPLPEAGFNPYFIRMLAAVLIPVGLCYLFALMDPDASRSLMVIVTSEKILAVIYSIGAFVTGAVGPMIWGVVLGDGALALIGIYAAINLYRDVETIDEMNDENGGEEKSPKNSQ